MTVGSPWENLLGTDQDLLDRHSTAERVADLLRQRIIDGVLEPGTQLSEGSVVNALSVSRNTLREAFRLLGHERLLVHEFHRGVFVRVLTAEDVTDLYRIRRLLETSAVRRMGGASRALIDAVHQAVSEGARAADEGAWREVGTANMRFHEALVGLADSTRLNEAMRQLLAELRLAFHAMSRYREFHERYLHLNREIADLVSEGAAWEAAERLEKYFDAAEHQLVATYRSQRS